MTMSVRDFIDQETIFESIQKQNFEEHFGVKMERINQGSGVVGDYFITETSKLTQNVELNLGHALLHRIVEFKNDKTSLKYNSFFVEYESTSDSWQTKRESGHVKAINHGCLLCINSGRDMYIFNRESFNEMLAYTTHTLQTKFRSNGNHPDSRTKGKIVPLFAARLTAVEIYRMPEKSPLQAIALQAR